MKISQEAREAWIAYEDYDGNYADLIRTGAWDDTAILVIMQSLINSTLERAAVVADAADIRGFRTGEAQTYIVTAIRQLIEE